jgi:uncharacterized protein YneF (UPF0154 family)
MLTQSRIERPVCLANKEALKQMMDELNKQLGIVPNPEITIEKLREMMRDEGIRSEDNSLSREVLRMRNAEE